MANVGSAASGMVLQGSGNAASPTFAALGVNSGLTANGVVISQNNLAFTATSSGSTGQVLTSNGPGVDPSFQPAAGGLLPWSNATSSKNMTLNTGYTVSAGGVTLTIPPTVPYGTVFRVAGNGNTWTLNYSVGQLIHIGNQTTTTTSGSLVATGLYDAVEILCTVANTVFVVINGPQGNITFN